MFTLRVIKNKLKSLTPRKSVQHSNIEEYKNYNDEDFTNDFLIIENDLNSSEDNPEQNEEPPLLLQNDLNSSEDNPEKNEEPPLLLQHDLNECKEKSVNIEEPPLLTLNEQIMATNLQPLLGIPFEFKDFLIQHTKSLLPDVSNVTDLLTCVQLLRIALSNNPESWIQSFGEDGVETIYKVMEIGNKNENHLIQTECLLCLETIMNHNWGLNVVLNDADCLKLLIQCLECGNSDVMMHALKILTVFGMLDNLNCLAAITEWSHFNQFDRFYPIINCVKTKDHIVQSHCIQFINVLLSQTTDFHDRIKLRNEILKDGLIEEMTDLKNETYPNLKIQIDMFENMREIDAEELHDKYHQLLGHLKNHSTK